MQNTFGFVSCTDLLLFKKKLRLMPVLRLLVPLLSRSGSHISENCTIAQCLVLPKTQLPPDTTNPASRSGERFLRWIFPIRRNRLLWIKTARCLPRRARIYLRKNRRTLLSNALPTLHLLFIGLVIISPVLLVVALAIKLTSKGPILFGHEREGKDGKIFNCWKFRTMVKDAESHQRLLNSQNDMDGPQFKIEHDPRIMPLGKILRAFNIDELPQLINVLVGQISLVGPRPSPFRENQICVPWRQARLSVRPGITGLWQMCRSERNSADFHQWIFYDMLYVRNMSLWLDFRILVATVLTLGGKWSVSSSWNIV